MRSCGSGYTSIEKFMILLNLPKPITKTTFDIAVRTITEVVTSAGKDTMLDAVYGMLDVVDSSVFVVLLLLFHP